MDPIVVAQTLGDAIGFVHVKDTVLDTGRLAVNGFIDPTPLSGSNRVWSYRAIGVGHGLDWWGRFLAAVRNTGYSGPISIEHEDPFLQRGEAIAANVQALRASLALSEIGS
jgi:sugar phosphate isomerase/epimerase